MMKCEDIQRELSAFISHDLDGATESEIQSHLKACPECSRVLRQMKRLSEVLHSWKVAEPSPMISERLKSRMRTEDSSWRGIFSASFVRKTAFRFAEIAAVVAATLLISRQLHMPAPTPGAEPAPINFYLVEHQAAVTQMISTELSPQPAVRIPVEREDFLYYEFIDEFPRVARPGLILKGRDFQREMRPVQTSPSSKESIITLEQARNAVDFPFVAPLWLHPGYILDSVRKIEDRNCLHLVYTNGIDTLSLFEQPANGEKGLAAKDFREYAVYRSVGPIPGQSNGQTRVTILAWGNDGLSLVLIGKADLSLLMDTCQAISSAAPINSEQPE
jgi:hypothetical protein